MVMVTYQSGSVEADVWDLSVSDYEYRLVSQLFGQHGKTKDFVLSISKIQKVENPTLLRKFERKKEDYGKKYGFVREKQVFHGTKSENIPSILVHNLEVQRYGSNCGSRFGAGMSFSAFSCYASCYTDETNGQMLLCKVLVSYIVEVPEDKTGSLLEPPYIPGKYPLRCDTTAKNKATMDVIVKWEDHTFIPAYVIHFNKTERRGAFNSGDSLHRSNRISNLPQHQTEYVREGVTYSSVTSGRQRQGRYELEAGASWADSWPPRPHTRVRTPPHTINTPPNRPQPDEPPSGFVIFVLLVYGAFVLWCCSGSQQARNGGYRY